MSGSPEGAVLSTCNRTEIYFSGVAPAEVLGLLAAHAGLSLEELRQSIYEKRGACAACHLFRVAAGLDSAVVGESEIVAQVKDAWGLSAEMRMSGPSIDLLFQRALEASKRIRTETDLCRNVTSTATLAVRRVADHFNVKTAEILVLGSGQIAERVCKQLASLGASAVRILNRSLSRAEVLAKATGAVAGTMEELTDALARAEAVICCLTVQEPVIHSLQVQGRTMPLLIVDMGMPANVDTCLSVSGVTVVRVDELSSQSSNNRESRLSAVPAALQILDQELGRFDEALQERAAAPTIRALVHRGEEVERRNLEWAKNRLSGLDEKEMRVVEELARRMVIGLLREPIEGLKGEFSAKEQREAIVRLFKLEGAANP